MKWGFLLLITLVTAFAGGCIIQQPQPQPLESKPGLGMWVWEPRQIADEAEQDKLIQFCREQGVNRLLVQVHLVPGSVERGAPALEYPAQLRRLMIVAALEGIRVEALDGSPEMAKAQNRDNVLAVLEAVLAFNRTLPVKSRFVGVHYDIEPYLLADWNTDRRAELMRDNLVLMALVRERLRNESPSMSLGASIPFWYDEKDNLGNSYTLEFQGQTKNFHQHLQDLTDYVAVMAYRKNALGENSITHHVQSEVTYADQIGRGVFVGVETNRLAETPDITFYGVSPEYFWSEKRLVDQTMGGRPGYAGVFVHSYEGFVRLVEKPIVRVDQIGPSATD